MAAMPMAMAYAPDCAKTDVLVHVRHGRDSSAPYLFMTLPYFSLLIDVGRLLFTILGILYIVYSPFIHIGGITAWVGII